MRVRPAQIENCEALARAGEPEDEPAIALYESTGSSARACAATTTGARTAPWARPWSWPACSRRA